MLKAGVPCTRQVLVQDSEGNTDFKSVLLAAAVVCADYDTAPAPAPLTAAAAAAAGICRCSDSGCINASAARAGGAPFSAGEAALPALTVSAALPALRLFVAVRGRCILRCGAWTLHAPRRSSVAAGKRVLAADSLGGPKLDG